MSFDIDRSVLEGRFWPKVDRRDEDECWMWRGAVRNAAGYGALRISGRLVRAHRIAFELAYGEIPEGKVVCHTCDRPACVNPRHLFLGTNQDNVADRHAKGRSNAPVGEEHFKARLTEPLVRAIRKEYAGGVSAREVAARYSITEKYVCQIASGRSWKHVPLELSAPLDRHRRWGGCVTRGTRHGCAKLNAEQVDAIRRRFVPRYGSMTALAREFSVSLSTVSKIVRGETWKAG